MKYDVNVINKLKESILNIKETSPLMLIGGSVVYLKQRYKNKIYTLRSNEDIRDFVANNYGKILPGVLVIEDIGDMNPVGQSTLLKFVEEYPNPLILLSYQDRVSPIMLSRCKQIIKLPQTEQVTNSMMEPKKALDALESYLSDDTSKDDRDRWISENSPKLYQLEHLIKGKPNKEKLIGLLSR